jgi:hypothetical protein
MNIIMKELIRSLQEEGYNIVVFKEEVLIQYETGIACARVEENKLYINFGDE